MTDTIIRSDKESNYSLIDNIPLNDSSLTFEARGVIGYLLSKPNDWQLSVSNIQKEGGIGRDKARRIVKELETAGYINRQRRHSESKKFTWLSIIFETPHLNPQHTHTDSTQQPIDVKTIDGKHVYGSTRGQNKTMPWKPVDGKHVDILIPDRTNIITPPARKAGKELSVTEKRRNATAEWLQESKIPIPQDEDTWLQVENPAIVTWLLATNTWPGYTNLAFLIRKLSTTDLSLETLSAAWELWKYSGNKRTNLVGILDWYANIQEDPHWKPIGRKSNGRSKDNHRKADQEHKQPITDEALDWLKSSGNLQPAG